MENSTKLGMNHTGIQMSPFDSSAQEEAIQEFQPAIKGDPDDFDEVHREYAREADRLGTIPLPGTMKGMVKTAAGKITGRHPEVLVDKLGERMAYERSGVRLYQAFIAKVEATDEPMAEKLLEDLRHIRSEEDEHFRLLWQTLHGMGADPTAVTPCAEAAAMQAMGIVQVLTEPRTTIGQCLNALQTVELADNAAWELLISLARACGKDDIADSFDRPLQNEKDHEAMIRGWVERVTMEEAA